MKRETLVIPLDHGLAIHLARGPGTVLLWLYPTADETTSDVLFLRAGINQVQLLRNTCLSDSTADLWMGEAAAVPLPAGHIQAVADFLGVTVKAVP